MGLAGKKIAEWTGDSWDLWVVAWGTEGRVFTAGVPSGVFHVWDYRTQPVRALWSGLLLKAGSITFRGSGHLAEGKANESLLCYYVETNDGAVEVLTPAEFRQRFPQSQTPE